MNISIITVSFNSCTTIKDTFHSVLNQTYKNIEYIVIDGNSKDNTVSIIKEYEPLFEGRMKWLSEPDNGLYDAMNKGIRMAKGDIIGIINSDDLFCDNDAIKIVVDEFLNKKEINAVYADLYYVSQDNTDKIIRKWKSGVQKSFKTGWHPAHPTLYIKREIYEKFGYFDLSFKLAADFELMLRYFDKFKIKASYLQRSFVKMRLGGTTNKSIKNILKQNIECIRAFKKNEIKVNAFIYPIFRLIPKIKQFTK
jgi:glycosyltransferase involved in cell wall biosynthesis